MDSGTVNEPLLTASTLAAGLGVPRRWVYRQVECHGMPAYRPSGRALLFELSAVRAWLQGSRVGDWPESCADPLTADPIYAHMQELPSG